MIAIMVGLKKSTAHGMRQERMAAHFLRAL
jgi:hypothetical protein